MKKVFIEIIAGVLAIALVAGAWLTGFYLTNLNKSLSLIFCLTLFGALLILAIVNITKCKNTKKEIAGMTPKTANAFGEKKKQEFETNCKKVEQKLKRIKELTIIYNTILIILILAANFFAGAAETITDNEGGVSLAVMVLNILLCQGLIAFYAYIIISPIDKSKFPVTREEYPAIMKIIDEAAELAGYKGKISVYLNPQGISISENGNKAIIWISAEHVALNTKNELLAVMLHEFAHYKNEDTKFYARNYAFKTIPENVPSVIAREIFTSELYMQTLINAELFEILSSKNREIKADAAVKNSPYSQDFINATAKGALFGIYSGYPWGEMCYDVYKGETPVTDFSHRNLANFKEKYKIYGEKWNYTLSHELPQRVDSHPTFKERAEKFGLPPVYTPTIETDPEFLAEQDKLLSYSDSASIKGINLKDYAFEREYSYTERKNAMDKYNSDTVNADFLPAHEKIECAQAFMNIDDEKALKILDEIINHNPSTLALYLKGVILAKNYNDECIDLFNRAAEDPACTDSALEQLALYALKTGNQKLIDDYRAKVVDKSERSVNLLKGTSLLGKKPTALDKNEPEIQEMISTFVGYWGDNLDEIHGVELTTEEGIRAMYFAFTLSKKFKPEMITKSYEDSMSYVTRLMDKSRVIYLVLGGGKEFFIVKSTHDSLLYKKSKK